MSVEEQLTELRIVVAERLTAIEGKVTGIQTSVEHWAEHTKRQNGRIDKIEAWMADRMHDMAHAAGVLAGRSELRRRDLAVLAGIVAGISALSATLTHVGELVHFVSG